MYGGTPANDVRFSNRPAQVATIVVFACFALLAVAGATERNGDGLPFFVAMGLLSLAMIGRSLIAPSVTLRNEDIVLRSVLRTRHIRYDEVTYAECPTGATGMAAPNRAFLRLVLRDRPAVDLKELNASPRKLENSSVRRAAEEINRRVELDPGRLATS